MYKTFVTTAYYIVKDGIAEWATDVDKTLPEFESKEVEQHETIEEALESASEWGSRWIMYPGLIIEDEDGSEVYSSIPELSKCECCGREEWGNIVSDLRVMKKKDGTRIFPELK